MTSLVLSVVEAGVVVAAREAGRHQAHLVIPGESFGGDMEVASHNPPARFAMLDTPCPTCQGKGVKTDPDSVGRAFAAVLNHGRGAGVAHLKCSDCGIDGRLRVTLRVPCPRCKGEPYEFDDPRFGCDECHGGGSQEAGVGSVAVLPVHEQDQELTVAWQHHVAQNHQGTWWLWLGKSDVYNDSTGRHQWKTLDITDQLDPLPRPGVDFVAVFTFEDTP